MTLVEMMFATGVGSLVCLATVSLLLFSLRSFQALSNYQDLNAKNRVALDTLSKDIRQAGACSTNAFTSTSLTLLGTNMVSSLPCTINYNYSSAATTLTRTYTDSAGSLVSILLTNCNYFVFSYYLRNPTNATFGVFTNDSGRPDLCKMVQVDWTCTRKIMGSPVDSQCNETARIVIRKD